MNYDLVYDAANQALFDWDFFGIGIVFSIIGAVLVLFPKIRLPLTRKSPDKVSLTFSWFFFGFAVFWTILAAGGTYLDNKETKIASVENTCSPLEGVIENFVPMPHEGGRREMFQVQNVKFEYSDYNLTGGFNNTASHGGPISEGLRVRICYLRRERTQENVIARLEVAS